MARQVRQFQWFAALDATADDDGGPVPLHGMADADVGALWPEVPAAGFAIAVSTVAQRAYLAEHLPEGWEASASQVTTIWWEEVGRPSFGRAGNGAALGALACLVLAVACALYAESTTDALRRAAVVAAAVLLVLAVVQLLWALIARSRRSLA